MAASASLRPKADLLQTTPCQTFGCDLRLPETGRVFIGLGTAEIGTKPSFAPVSLNVGLCLKLPVYLRVPGESEPAIQPPMQGYGEMLPGRRPFFLFGQSKPKEKMMIYSHRASAKQNGVSW